MTKSLVNSHPIAQYRAQLVEQRNALNVKIASLDEMLRDMEQPVRAPVVLRDETPEHRPERTNEVGASMVLMQWFVERGTRLANTAEVARAFKIPRGVASSRCSTLYKHGGIERVDRGVYRLNPHRTTEEQPK